MEGSAFKVHRDVINRHDLRNTYNITCNSTVTLAVVRRSGQDNRLHQFDGFGADMPLDKTYDATIIVQDKAEEPVSKHTIKNYIRNGNVVIDKENNIEV